MFSSNTSQVADGGYQISRSLRFNSADSAYLNRTPASAGNRTTWTWSAWIKLSGIATEQHLFGAANATLWFRPTAATLEYYDNSTAYRTTTQVFRDPSSWYHLVLVWDSGNATAGDRVRLYVNGQQITAFGTTNNPAQNTTSGINSTNTHNLGRYFGGGYHFDGYMTEVNFIDGQALTPSSFGETNAQTGVWQPKAYSGSYGTNGFYLNFSDNSNTTAATLGKDYSGNGNNWTPNNFSVAAGAGNDSLVDTPTPYGSDTGAGGEVRGNYCTWNPLAADSSAIITNGNLDVATAAAGVGQARGTIGVSSGKWYWEVTRTTSGANLIVGIVDSATGADKYPGQTSGSYGYYGLDGTKINNGSFSAYGASFAIGDVIGVALDLDAGTLVFYKNGTSQGTAFTGLSGTFFPAASDDTGGGGMNYWGNFGQRPFAYTAPSGFKALCTQNLPTPTIGATTATQAGKYFDVVLRNGGGSSGGTYSTTVNMSNGALLWDKPRNTGGSNYLVDSVRGISKNLRSNVTNAESTDATWFTNFGSSSFTTGSSDWGTGTTVVDWIWAANGSGSTNTAGSITSTVSANTTSGFSIVTYTGTGANATVGHGLGAAPRMIIVKRRDSVEIWPVYHESIGNTQYLRLQGDNPAGTFNVWQNTSPTSSVFYISTDSTVNTNTGTYVAYCFAPIAGYSAFGSYTGNGSSTGPFVFTGFKPAFVLIKRTDDLQNWFLMDNKRNPANAVDNYLMANSSDAAADFVPSQIDFLSNGFKLLGTAAGLNASGGNYIYMAVAENPFKYSLAR